ncbi:hypothetical protein EGK75_13250 [Neisseria weixii]|uniref:Uncharacterized protein n=1 Tax=Neisseria weixii TaxID=1853276 RepID=A0A3N4MHM4_9NEIS|nr:hypothetical protein EGK74_13240 [Neisseria weixii]RPD83373.1 hypothetical protein EGK75_13250 [Neisseria weixii]
MGMVSNFWGAVHCHGAFIVSSPARIILILFMPIKYKRPSENVFRRLLCTLFNQTCGATAFT